MSKLKVLSLAWEYQPDITSGIGVACEGLNVELSKMVDLTVILTNTEGTTEDVKHEKVSVNIQSGSRSKKVVKGSLNIVGSQTYKLPIKLDPYFDPYHEWEMEYRISEKAFRKQEDILIDVENTNTDVIEISSQNSSETRELLPKPSERDIFNENVKTKILLYTRMVEDLVRNSQFDVIHAHDWMTFLAGVNLKHQHNKPLVLHVHSLDYDRTGTKKISWVYDIERYAISEADLVIAVSNYTGGLVKSNYGLSKSKLMTIHNSFDNITNSLSYTPKKHKKVLFAGRIIGEKGIHYFIDIARQVYEKYKDVEFIVAGSNFGKFDFENYKELDPIRHRFTYTGVLPREKLFKLYKKVDVLCMPSVSEPFGMVALEAASCGLPVVLSKNSGVSEVLPHAPSAAFWDTELMAQHIYAILKSKTLRQKIVKQSLRDIKDLTWKNAASKVVNAYKSLVEV